jgi:hypothetical protein
MYRIKDWDTLFESKDSRKLKHARYVCVPNKHDGKGFRRLEQHPRKVELFCAWNLILQVASKCPRRGILVDGDGPMSPADLALKTNFPEAIFSLAFEFFSSGGKLAWLEPISGTSGGTSENLPGSPDEPGDFPESPRNLPGGESEQESASPGDSPEISRVLPDFRDRREGKGIEGKREADARARVTQAHYDRALRVLEAYPDRAAKDQRPIAKDGHAQSILATRIAADPEYPFEEHARLERQNPTPRNAHAWALTVPDWVALKALRKTAAPTERQRL